MAHSFQARLLADLTAVDPFDAGQMPQMLLVGLPVLLRSGAAVGGFEEGKEGGRIRWSQGHPGHQDRIAADRGAGEAGTAVAGDGGTEFPAAELGEHPPAQTVILGDKHGLRMRVFHRLPERIGDGGGFLFRTRRLHQIDAFHRPARDGVIVRRLCQPGFGHRGRSQGLAEEPCPLRTLRRLIRPYGNLLPGEVEPFEEQFHRVLRMSRCEARLAGHRLPCPGIEIRVETRQHHRPLGEFGDGGRKPRRDPVGQRRPGDQHRMCGGKGLPLGGQVSGGQRPALLRIRFAAFAEPGRPELSDDGKEAQCVLPMPGVLAGHRGAERRWFDTFRVQGVEQLAEIVREADGIVRCRRVAGLGQMGPHELCQNEMPPLPIHGFVGGDGDRLTYRQFAERVDGWQESHAGIAERLL